jgi:hypothetical protein
MASSWFSFSEPFNRGIDFNQTDSADVEVLLSGSTNLTISVIKFADTAVLLSSSSDVSVSSYKITFADVALTALSVTVTVATERQDALVDVSANTTMTVDMMKFAYSESSLSSSSDASSTITRISEIASTLSSAADITVESFKIAISSTAVSASSSLTSAAVKISQAVSALSSSVQLAVAGKISLATIRIVLEEVGAVVVQTPVVFAQSIVAAGIDSSIYRTLVLLDGKPLTIHNRKLDMGVEQIFTETVNWNNRKTRYYKSSSRAGRRTFSMSWSWLPNSINYTVDGNSGRDFIKRVAEDPRHHVLKIINMDETGTTPYSETSYNVLVKDYSETLIRRDIPNDVYFWDCSMSLEEV